MELRTPRLQLLPFSPEDTDELHALFAERDVRRWLLDDTVVTRDWVEEEVVQSQTRFAESGAGLWTVREPDVGSIIGFVGFRPFFDPPELQLLYGFLPDFWGRGLATEAATAATDHAFEALDFEEVRAATDVPNVASIAVLRRLGMQEWDRSDEGAEGTIFFRIGREEWRTVTR